MLMRENQVDKINLTSQEIVLDFIYIFNVYISPLIKINCTWIFLFQYEI
jgi:hypothetical protein